MKYQKTYTCKQCFKQFKWYRHREICNNCRVLNKKQSDNKWRTKSGYKQNKPMLGTTKFISSEIVIDPKTNEQHVRGWLELHKEEVKSRFK